MTLYLQRLARIIQGYARTTMPHSEYRTAGSKNRFTSLFECRCHGGIFASWSGVRDSRARHVSAYDYGSVITPLMKLAEMCREVVGR